MTQISPSLNKFLGFKSEPKNAVMLQLLGKFWIWIPCLQGGKGMCLSSNLCPYDESCAPSKLSHVSDFFTVKITSWYCTAYTLHFADLQCASSRKSIIDAEGNKIAPKRSENLLPINAELAISTEGKFQKEHASMSNQMEQVSP